MALILDVAFVPVVALVLVYTWELVKQFQEPVALPRPITIRSRNWSIEAGQNQKVRTKVGCSN
jgi:hypothetical protein